MSVSESASLGCRQSRDRLAHDHADTNCVVVDDDYAGNQATVQVVTIGRLGRILAVAPAPLNYSVISPVQSACCDGLITQPITKLIYH